MAVSLPHQAMRITIWVRADHLVERRIKMEAINSCNETIQRTYTAEQISKILGVSLRKAYDLCETTTDFKVLRLGKRCVRVHKESFDNWLNGQFNTL